MAIATTWPAPSPGTESQQPLSSPNPPESGTSEVGFIPGDENHRVTGPCARMHDSADRITQEGVAGGNQRLYLGKIARVVGSGGPPVHVMTLVGTDPGIICDVSVAQVGRELAEIGYIGDPRRAALYVLIGNEGVMLSLIELVAT